MKLKEFIQTELWRTTGNEISSRYKRIGYATLKTIILSVRGFGAKRLNVRAHSLTFCLMFAIIPILAMLLAIGRGFGFADMIEEWLASSFLGEMNLTGPVMEMVNRYLETAHGGIFLGIGLLILIWAVYNFFRNMELSFNEIWDVKNSRSVLRKLTNYFGILLLIPLLIVVTSGLSIWFNTAASSIPEFQALHQYHHHLVKIASYIFLWLVFTWMYKAVPNTKVHFLAAFIPGVLIGTLFQVLQALSVYIIVFLSRTSIIYGAFAIIPILMMWIQWSCLLILIGAEMSYAIQNKEEFDYEMDLNTMSRRYKDYVMLYILSVIIHRFENDEEPLTAMEIAEQENLPIRLVSQLLSRLEETHIIRDTYVEGKEDKAFQPAMDIRLITIGMVIKRVDAQGAENFLHHPSPAMQRFWGHYLELKQNNYSIQQICVSEL